MNEADVSHLITSLLSNATYGSSKIEIISEFSYSGYQPDLILKAHKRNIAAVEIKSNSQMENFAKSFSIDYYFKFSVRYFIYTDGNDYYVYDRFKNPNEYQIVNRGGFLKIVTTQLSSAIISKLKRQAIDIIIDYAKNKPYNFQRVVGYLNENSRKMYDELKLSASYTLYFAGSKNDTSSFEHNFFKELLDNNVPDVIYKYCSFVRGFEILRDNEMAMHGLPGMNDSSEPNYVDNYLNQAIREEVWEMAPESRATINRRFIMSCSTKKDYLLLWRLYGDDAKGVCIELKTNNLIETTSRFYLGKVKYADSNNEHIELNFLRNILQRIREVLMVEIRFVLMFVWRHFFKPHEYEYESEVRLLYIHNREERQKHWVMASPYSIVNPMVVFDLSNDHFPLSIKEMMLGAKTPERKLNKSQLEQMLKEKNRRIQISESGISVYR